MFGPVAFPGVSTSCSALQPKASMVGLAVASIDGCRLVPTDLQLPAAQPQIEEYPRAAPSSVSMNDILRSLLIAIGLVS
jgi:hypothetical protein